MRFDSTLRRIAAALALAVLAASGPLAAQQPASAADQPYAAEIAAFEAFVEPYMEAVGIPGLSVAVMKDDWVWARGFGWADVENRSPAKPESAYRLASVTKPMTAVAVLELWEEGKLDLDAPIQTYVPYFPEKGHPITARQLLGHLGGISHYVDYDAEGHFKDPKTTEESIAVFAGFDLVAEPGERYSYTSYGYNLLGAAIEGVSGVSYGEFMAERVWGPMGMKTTRMDDPYELILNRVRGYRLRGGRLENSEFVDISSRFAAGGTRSTVIDLIRFVQGVEANAVLTPETTRLMLASQANRDGRYTGYGMGWSDAPVNGRPRAGHGGGQPETSTLLTWFPADRFAIALAANLEGAGLQAVQEKLLRLFYDETWNVLAFLPDERERAIYYALAGAFGHGLAAARRGAEAPDPVAVEAAFASLNRASSARAWSRDRESALATLRNGRHPAGDHAWVALGSWVARQLAGDDHAYQQLHHGGPLAFFAAWIDHYRGHRPRVPRRQRLSRELERLVSAWAADWTKVWTPELRSLVISRAVDPDELETTLRAAFEGVTVVPDYSPELVAMAEIAFENGDQARGLRMAQMAIDLYPEAENTNGLWGVVLLSGGNVEAGLAHLRKAAAIDPNGYVAVGNLMGIVDYFRGIEAVPIARALLEAMAGIHPESERVRDALAELEP